jgi:hypothetical protein
MLIGNPIRKVLSSMRTHRVRVLLMDGQACILYGAAEFSRDTDFAILSDSANLARLRKALAELQAKVIAVPPFQLKYLRRGHAIHFRYNTFARNSRALSRSSAARSNSNFLAASRISVSSFTISSAIFSGSSDSASSVSISGTFT